MDEPLSNLDAQLREELRSKFVESKNNLVSPQSMLLTTRRGFAVSDLICVLNEGKVQQTGSPIEMYQNPANFFVASFVRKQLH